MNYCFYIILLTLINKNKENFQVQGQDPGQDPGQVQGQDPRQDPGQVQGQENLFEIFEGSKKVGNINPGDNNLEDMKYISQKNPLFPSKKFKMLIMKKDYVFNYNRDDNLEDPLTLGLYLKPDFTNEEVFTDFIELEDSTNQIKIKFELHNRANNYQLSFKITNQQ